MWHFDYCKHERHANFLREAEKRKALLKSGRSPARSRRSKALSAGEQYTVSQMFDMPGLKEALDGIIIEVFNSQHSLVCC